MLSRMQDKGRFRYRSVHHYRMAGCEVVTPVAEVAMRRWPDGRVEYVQYGDIEGLLMQTPERQRAAA